MASIPSTPTCPVEILRRDSDIDSVPLQLDGRAPRRRSTAEHEGVAAVNRQPYAVSLHRSMSRAGGMTFWHQHLSGR